MINIMTYCPYCGQRNDKNLASANPFDIECLKCQKSFQVIPSLSNKSTYNQYCQQQKPAKSRIAFIIIALFLGSFGIHNFYAGFAGRGIMQLLLSLFGFILCFIPNFFVIIWIICEIAAVDTDSDGQYFI